MSVDQIKAAIEKRIWQAIASSGVDVSGIAKADLEKLVDHITSEVLVEIDDQLGEASAIPEIQSAPGVAVKATIMDVLAGEQLLWEGRPFLSLVERYAITDERVRILTGLVGREHEDIELARVKDVDWKQGMGERMLGIGDIIVNTADTTRPRAVLRHVRHPEQVHEILRRAVIEVRKKYHIIFEQEM
jgi:membrane protein YdbS with pleckstrin-like domain